MAMPGTGLATAVAGGLIPFLEYFRPTKSPYLLMVLFGIIGLLVLDYLFGPRNYETFYWYWLAIPIAGVLIFVTSLMFRDKTKELESKQEDGDEFEAQLKFSRSVCISTAILCLAVGGVKLSSGRSDFMFFFHFGACVCQLLVFLAFATARLRREEPRTSMNHVQIALVTSLFILGASTSISLSELQVEVKTWNMVGNMFWNETKDGYEMDLYVVTAACLYSLWGRCQCYWIKRLTEIVRISVVD